MLIYDRRRCRPLPGPEVRRRLALSQRAKLSHLEQGGWRLLFVRNEPATAYVQHAEHGHAIVTRDARLVMARSLRTRHDDATAMVVAAVESVRASAAPVDAAAASQAA
ncbi:hypothetical protein [Lysobacter humi (ex Lee et al. 2017)]